MLQPVQHQVEQFHSPGDFIAILCEGQFSRAQEQQFPLAQPVSYGTRQGIIVGVISGHNPNDVNRVRVSFFDRLNWIVRHEWKDKGVLTRIESKTASR